MKRRPVVLRGFLGWGNRKGGLETYGPGGRWAPPRNGQDTGGDLFGDALDEAGASEGATLLVIAVPPFGDLTLLDDIERFVDARRSSGEETPDG